MKNVLYLIILLLMVGCKDDKSKNTDTHRNINVPYKSCQCEEGKYMQPMQRGTPSVDWVIQEEAYLFKDALPEQLPSMYDDNDLSILKYCIIYDSKTNDVCMYECGRMSTDMGRICNFPDFAKKWTIPEDGCKIYFEGTKISCL